jgi:hypothetical protein
MTGVPYNGVESYAQPIAKRADQLVVGDRILNKYLPSPFSPDPGEVVFVKVHEYRTARWVFVAYRLPDGFYDSTAYLPEGELEVYPAADPEITQPIGERPLVVEGGVWAVPVAGGLIEVDPPEGFVPASASIVQLTHLLWISGTTACGLGPERQLGLSLTTVQTGVTCQACVDEMPF